MSDDYANSASTTTILNFLPIVNNTVSIDGTIEVTGDKDWFKIYLIAGESYRFFLDGKSLGDAHLYVYNSSGAYITADDDSGGNADSLINFSAPNTGFYYLEARKHGDNGTGTYTLSVSGNLLDLSTSVAINTHYAYLTDSTNGLQIKDISNVTSPTQTATFDTSGEANDVSIKGTLAYVADGSAGLQIIDVSNPAAPTRVAGLNTSGTAYGVTVSADNFAYIADGDKGLKIVDVDTPSSPLAGGSYDTTGTAYDVAVNGNYVYLADGDSGLQVINVANPVAPVRVGGYDTTGIAQGITISGTTAYVADGDSGLEIFDLSNPAAPTLLATYNTPGNARSVTVNNHIAYVADATSLQAIDVSNPASPTLITSYNNNAWGVAVAGHYAFVAASGAVQAVQIVANNAPSGTVTIAGNAVQGQTLTASNTLADADGLGTVTYTWESWVTGATTGTILGNGNSYQLTANDAGKTITATVSYIDSSLTTESITSAATAVVGGNVLPSGSVTITGSAVQGQTLTAHNTLTDSNGLGTITYTWISRATVLGTGDSYTLTAADLGKTIFVAANYSDGAGVAESVISANTSTVTEGNSNHLPQGSVTITGNAIKGQTLTVSNNLTDADGLGVTRYQWQANGVNVGTNSTTYTLTAADIGKTLTVTANYTDLLGNAESVLSSATSSVADTTNHTPDGAVTLSDTTPTVGDMLSVSNNLTDADGMSKAIVSYQWKADSSVLGTGATYTVTAAELGKSLTVIARYTDDSGTAESVVSATTAAVVKAPDSGTPGFTFTPQTGTVTGEDGSAVSYAVSLNSQPIRDVTLSFTSSNLKEGMVSSAKTMTFTNSNWSTAQMLTVAGVDDTTNDGNVSYQITVAVSTFDVYYKLLTVQPLALTNTDNDVAVPGKVIYGDVGGSKVDVITSGAGDNQSGDGNDTIYGLNMPDDLSGGLGNDTIYGGLGPDNLFGQDGNDYLWGNEDADYMDGGAGNDTLDGGTGRDTMVGGAGNDTYYLGYDAADVINDQGLSTDVDTIIMPYSIKTYTLPKGIEAGTIAPGTQTSSLTGNTSDNTLTGNDGKNTLNGAVGRDSLFGGSGNDVLNGGIDNDNLTGGAGKDIFLFDTALTSNVDKITDFKPVDDTIKLDNQIFTQLTVLGTLDASEFFKGAAAHDPNDYVIYNPSTGVVTYDSDGSGAGQGVQIAQLGVNLSITNADFVVI